MCGYYQTDLEQRHKLVRASMSERVRVVIILEVGPEGERYAVGIEEDEGLGDVSSFSLDVGFAQPVGYARKRGFRFFFFTTSSLRDQRSSRGDIWSL